MGKPKTGDKAKLARLQTKLARARYANKEMYVVIQQQKHEIEAGEILLKNAMEDSYRWQTKYREARRAAKDNSSAALEKPCLDAATDRPEKR